MNFTSWLTYILPNLVYVPCLELSSQMLLVEVLLLLLVAANFAAGPTHADLDVYR
jgi:hypothetical protein